MFACMLRARVCGDCRTQGGGCARHQGWHGRCGPEVVQVWCVVPSPSQPVIHLPRFPFPLPASYLFPSAYTFVISTMTHAAASQSFKSTLTSHEEHLILMHASPVAMALPSLLSHQLTLVNGYRTDHVFGFDAKQADIYNRCARGIVDSCLEGENHSPPHCLSYCLRVVMRQDFRIFSFSMS